METYCDYLRLGAWTTEAYLDQADFRRMAHDWRPGRWLQYQGNHSADLNAFFGIGDQNGKRHYIMRVAGSRSQELLEKKLPAWYCTRIDVQRTISMPDHWDSIAEYMGLAVPRRSKSFVESETGATIYVGVRESETFARCYEKHVDGEHFLRLEFELKGKKARIAYDAFKREAVTLEMIYDHLLADFSLPERWERLFDYSKADAQADFLAVSRQRSNERVLEWLGSLESSILAYGNDPEIGETVRRFVRSWAHNLDKNA